MNSNTSAFESGSRRGGTSSWRLWLGYALMVAGTVGIFLIVQHFGDQLTPVANAAANASAAKVPAAASHAMMHVLLALVAVIISGRLLGQVFRHFGQPRVIGEMVAGIMLGPSLLGRISPEAMHFVLPPEVGPYLGIIAQLGVILYMFLVGLELNSGLLRAHAHATVAISHASIVAPFCLGSILALFLYRGLRAVHQLRPLHGRGDVDHRVPRPRANSYRP
jgi:hypothetical protein